VLIPNLYFSCFAGQDHRKENASVPTDATEPTKPASNARWLVLVLAIAFVFLYLSLFRLSGTPIFHAGDESVFWTNASRMLAGDAFLKDFHQFTPPGIDLVYATVFHFFGPGVRTINWTILSMGMVLGVVCFFIARVIMRAGMSVLAALLCVVLLYGDRMDLTHHWFSSLANLLAILILMQERSYGRIGMAACFIGTALFFTQSGGFMGLLACCVGLLWERRTRASSSLRLTPRLALFLGVVLCVWLLLSWRFIAQAGPATYLHMQVLYLPRDVDFSTGFLVPHFVVSHYPHSVAQFANRIAMYLLLVLVCPVVVILCARGKVVAGDHSMPIVFLTTLGILQTVEVIFMLNWNRMAAVAMPAAILFVWLITHWPQAVRPAVIGCWYFLGAMMIVQCAVMQFHHYPRVNLPTGVAVFQNNEAEEARWLALHTRPGDYFFEVATARFYAPLKLRNPSAVDMLGTTAVTLPEWVGQVVEGLKIHQVQYILWEPHAGIGTVQTQHQAPGDHLDLLRKYLQQNFKRVEIFSNGGEIWERATPR
jgi:hypothetical protein